MKVITLAFLSVMLFSAGCGENSHVTFEQTLTHPNGLVVSVPTGFNAKETAAGYLLSERADVRSPRQLSIKFASEVDATQNLTRSREVLGVEGPVKFAVSNLGAGSGGTEYELVAVKPVTGGLVTVEAVEQSELGEPAFATAWALLEVAHRL